METEKFSPLVTVTVITYNSSKFVIETMESIKAQTYPNIELIVSDDCSKDNTIEIVSEWLQKNKTRFVEAKLITTDINTGIPGNKNRAIAVAKGEWLKSIAGDDLLIETAIEDFVFFVQKNKCNIVFGRMKTLKMEKISEQPVNPFFFLTQKQQYEKVFAGSGIPAPASFIRLDLIKSVGGYNEDYKFIEDVPFWIAVAKKGEKFFYIDSFVIIYRIHENNISFHGKHFVNIKYYNDLKKLVRTEINPELRRLKKKIIIFNNFNYFLVTDLIILLGNKYNMLSKVLSFLILRNLFKKFKNILNFN